MPNKSYRISHGLQKGFLPKHIKNKNKEYKKMCRTKDLTKCKIIEEFKTYKNNLLKLTRASKFNHYNNYYFQANRLNLFKTWEGIRDKKIISIPFK